MKYPPNISYRNNRSSGGNGSSSPRGATRSQLNVARALKEPRPARETGDRSGLRQVEDGSFEREFLRRTAFKPGETAKLPSLPEGLLAGTGRHGRHSGYSAMSIPKVTSDYTPPPLPKATWQIIRSMNPMSGVIQGLVLQELAARLEPRNYEGEMAFMKQGWNLRISCGGSPTIQIPGSFGFCLVNQGAPSWATTYPAPGTAVGTLSTECSWYQQQSDGFWRSTHMWDRTVTGTARAPQMLARSSLNGPSIERARVPYSLLPKFNRALESSPFPTKTSGDGDRSPPPPRTFVNHRRAPPGKRVQERKLVGQKKALTVVSKIFTNGTEFTDLVESFHDALPKDCKSKGKPQGMSKNSQKMADLASCFHRVDMVEAMVNVIANHLQDKIIGRLNQGATKGLAKMIGWNGVGKSRNIPGGPKAKLPDNAKDPMKDLLPSKDDLVDLLHDLVGEHSLQSTYKRFSS